MRRYWLLAASFVIGFAGHWAVERRSVAQSPLPTPSTDAATIVTPTADGSRLVNLRIRRVARAGEMPDNRMPITQDKDGLVIPPTDWVVSLPDGVYVLTPER